MNNAPLLIAANLNQPLHVRTKSDSMSAGERRSSLEWNDVAYFWKLNIGQLLEETIFFVPKTFCNGPNIGLLGVNILGTLGDALSRINNITST